MPDWATAAVTIGEFGSGWLHQLPGFGLATGYWDLGRTGGSIVIDIDNRPDALPVKELVDLPFASKVRTTWAGKESGVMHACGHDTHVAILMGVAEVLVQLKDQLPGSVELIFQPAEEGPPPGEEGGAALMVKEMSSHLVMLTPSSTWVWQYQQCSPSQ